MSIKRKLNIVFYLLTFIFLFIAGLYLFQRGNDKKDKVNIPSISSSHIQMEDGMTIIELNPMEMANSGITTIKLIQTKHQAQLTAYGTVVSIQDLSKDVQSYEADKAQLAKSEESQLISQNNYERTKSLYEKKLASEQDFQTAQASFLSDQADVSSAQSYLSSLRSLIVEQWGNEISRWIFNNTNTLKNLLELKEELIRISFSSNEQNIRTPENIFIQSPSSNKRILCRFISEGHLTNSQFQTKALYYIASNSTLSGGMNIKAYLPIGRNLPGVIVQDSSIIWYQGKAWVYKEISSNKFIRAAVSVNNPVDDGFFVPNNKGLIIPGVTIVKNGAQLLLSEELIPTQGSQSDGGDND